MPTFPEETRGVTLCGRRRPVSGPGVFYGTLGVETRRRLDNRVSLVTQDPKIGPSNLEMYELTFLEQEH